MSNHGALPPHTSDAPPDALAVSPPPDCPTCWMNTQLSEALSTLAKLESSAVALLRRMPYDIANHPAVTDISKPAIDRLMVAAVALDALNHKQSVQLMTARKEARLDRERAVGLGARLRQLEDMTQQSTERAVMLVTSGDAVVGEELRALLLSVRFAGQVLDDNGVPGRANGKAMSLDARIRWVCANWVRTEASDVGEKRHGSGEFEDR